MSRLPFEFRIALTLIISVQLAFGASIFLATPNAAHAVETKTQTRAEREAKQAKVSQAWAQSMKDGFGGRDPALKDIMSVDLQAIKDSLGNFSNVPTDQDPYFLRSQRWIPSTANVETLSSSSNSKTTTVFVPGVKLALELPLPLVHLTQTDDYVIFSLRSESDLFNSKAGSAPSQGAGLFLIETHLLEYHAARRSPVAVYFIPLMGQGWREGTAAEEFVEFNQLVLSDGPKILPISIDDIDQLVQVSKVNRDIGVMIALSRRDAGGSLPDETIYPAPGSTALFGLVSTGMDLSRPGYNFFRDFKSDTTDRTKSFSSQLGKFWSVASAAAELFARSVLGVQRAFAGGLDASGDPLAAAVMKSAWFLSIVGATLVVSFALKYKNPFVKNRLREIRDYRRALNPTAVDGEGMIGLRDYLRVEGSLLASIAQFPLIAPGKITEWLTDRYAPTLASGDHTLMRQVLNLTVYPNLHHFGDIAVNEKVTVLGAGYAATVGIGITALHYFYLLPGFTAAVSPSLPPALSFAVNDAFASDNRDTQATLFTNMLVGASIGILRGPADFTMDAKSQVIEELYRRVDNTLRREGLDPRDKNVQTRRTEMRTRLVDLTLVQKGLPTSEEKLFDAMMAFNKIGEARGFVAPSPDDLRSAAVGPTLDEETLSSQIKSEGNFVLAERNGLAPNVIARALRLAQLWSEKTPSPSTTGALRLAQKVQADTKRSAQVFKKTAEFFLWLTTNPTNLLRPEVTKARLAQLKSEIQMISEKAKSLRRLIVVTGYEGPVEAVVRYVPKEWVDAHGVEAASQFVRYLRQALASYLDGSKIDNLIAQKSDLIEYQHQALVRAVNELRAERPELSMRSDQSLLDDPFYNVELQQRSSLIAKKMGDQYRADRKAEGFSPKFGWIENWQHRRALKKAKVQLVREIGGDPNKIQFSQLPSQFGERLKALYLAESAKLIGLHIPTLAGQNPRAADGLPWQTSNEIFDAVIREIRTSADAEAQRQLNTPEYRVYLQKLSPEQAEELKSRLYSIVYLSAYRDKITLSGSIYGRDSSQPGFTQRLRQALAARSADDLSNIRLDSQRRPETLGRIEPIRRNLVITGGALVNRGLRFIDSMFNDVGVEHGALGAIQRRLFFAEEIVSANIRNLKLWPVGLSISWLWSHFALGTGISYSFWVTSFLFQGFFIMAPVQWLFRNFRMQDFKPYDSKFVGAKGVADVSWRYSLAEMLAYTATFVAVVPPVLLHTTLGQTLMTHVGAPVGSVIAGLSGYELLATLLGVSVASWVGSRAIEGAVWRNLRDRLSALKVAGSAEKVSELEGSRQEGRTLPDSRMGGVFRCSHAFQ